MFDFMVKLYNFYYICEIITVFLKKNYYYINLKNKNDLIMPEYYATLSFFLLSNLHKQPEILIK